MNSNESCLTVEVRDDLSVNDLIGLRKKGFFVFRSGHLGNHYLSNLLLFACGVPCHLFDRNLVVRDRNYWPEFILAEGSHIPLADPIPQKASLVYFASANKSVLIPGLARFFAESNIAGTHFKSMEESFKYVWSESHFLDRHLQLVFCIVSELANISPELFQRVFGADGVIGKEDCISKNAIAKEIVETNSYFRRYLDEGQNSLHFSKGRLMSIEANVLVHSICACLITGKSEVYEISGPDMVRYATNKGFCRKLSDCYNFLRKRIDFLPPKVTLNIVPSFYFRFGSLFSERAEMDCLWQSLKEFFAVNKEKRRVLNETKRTFQNKVLLRAQIKKLAEISEFYNKDLRIIAAKIHSGGVGRRIDFDLAAGNFFSQYDLLLSGEQLYIPKEAISTPMNKLFSYFKCFETAKQYTSEV